MLPERRTLWFRRLALAGALLAATVVVLGAWVRLTDAGLGCPDWPGLLRSPIPAGRSRLRQSHSRDGASLFCDHSRNHHHQLAALGALEPQESQPAADPGRAAHGDRLSAGRTGCVDRHQIAQAIDRDGAFAGRPDHAGSVVVAVTVPGRRALSRREASLQKYAWVGTGSGCCCRFHWEVGPAPTTRRWPAQTCPPASNPGGLRWISTMLSFCGAARTSTTPAAFSATRRAPPFMSPTASGRCWREVGC